MNHAIYRSYQTSLPDIAERNHGYSYRCRHLVTYITVVHLNFLVES